MSETTLKEKTAKGLMWGAVNNLSVQLLSALIGIVLGRILSPGEYGMVGMLAIFSAIAVTLSESGFSAAIANMKSPSHREYNAVFWFSTLCALLLYALLFLAAPLIAAFFHQPALVSLSRLVFASFVVAAIGTAQSAYMFKNMMNREKAVVSIAAIVVSGAVGIALALTGYSYWSLAWQQFVFMLVTFTGRFYYVRWLPTLPVDWTPIARMFGFSSKILITNIINQVNANILSFIFGRLFAPRDVGNYSQAAKWSSMGYNLISGTLQQVAQPVMAAVNDDSEGRQVNVFRKMLRFTAFLSMPAMLGLALVADFVVLLLGPQWSHSVPLLRIMAVSGAFLPIQTLYQNLFVSHGRSDTYMWCTLAQVVVQTSVILLFSPFGIQTMVTVFAAAQILWLAVWQTLARRLMALRLTHVLSDVLPFLLSALACTVLAYWLTRPLSHPVVLIAARIAVTAVLYAAVMKVARVRIFSECIDFFLHRKTINNVNSHETPH